jgi:catechol 2,3-dioxygenase-like lactoylglutathione lyase family enzyme
MSFTPHLQFSHFGIYVTDLDKMVDFYTRFLGFMIADRGMAAIGMEMLTAGVWPGEWGR